MRTVAVIVAGGAGLRAAAAGGGAMDEEPKQFRALAGRTVIDRALSPFLSNPGIDAVLAVVRPGWENRVREIFNGRECLLDPVPGGLTRQESVRLGLEALTAVAPDRVLIHDAARPFVDRPTIDRVVAALDAHTGAVPAKPVTDTLKRADNGMIAATVDRTGLFAVQTPQGFAFAPILQAHRDARAVDREFTDDAAIAEWAGIEVALVAGDSRNRKLTTREDFDMAEALLAAGTPGDATEIRTGSGFDVHRFGPGGFVTLCGVAVPHDRGLLGHSDADVGLHALTDALLGAIAEGDIGSHFPPDDPQWQAADSALFLRHAAALVRRRGASIVNLDVTLICERPKVGPHRDGMRRRIAEIVEVDISRISVKATTTEGLGFAGRAEGIAAQAAASVRLPVGDPA